MIFELRNSGLLYSQENGKDIVLSDLIKQYKKNVCSSQSYDKENKTITITIDGEAYSIKLTEDQVFLYENGIEDQLINRLRDITMIDKENALKRKRTALAAKNAAEEKEFKEQTMAQVAKGELPNDLRGINVYNKELNSELKSTAASIGKGVLMAVIPAALFVGGALVTKNAIGEVNSLPRLLKTMLAAAMLIAGGVVAFGDYLAYWNGFLTPAYYLRKSIEKIKIIRLKKKDLREHKKEIKRLQKSSEGLDDFKRYILEKKGQETIRAAEYSEEALNEIKEVLEIVKQLPKKEQEQYVTKMLELIEDYKIKRVEMIKSTEKYLFGEVEEVRKLKSAITPTLEEIKLDVKSRLERLSLAKNVERQCDSLAIDAKEQAFNGWTDDLTAGNMLKAR